ncbi:MAG: hypothetical protein EOO54_08385 [Haliea sp.]|nr:MAG: hypothetical protein EOO54_08385 [Haliea sp.]
MPVNQQAAEQMRHSAENAIEQILRHLQAASGLTVVAVDVHTYNHHPTADAKPTSLIRAVSIRLEL